MCALVRQDGAGLVRLDFQRCDYSFATPRYTVWPDVVLRERPDRRLRVSHEDALVEPRPKQSTCFLFRARERQVDDVVRIASAEHVALGR